ncbi:MAG: hypothetical protein AAF191_20635 [Verrucomicrobiota bacterium]
MNLLTILEQKVEREEVVGNDAELKRKQKREEDERLKLEKAGQPLAILAHQLSRITQTSVKFIRWICIHLHKSTPWDQAVDRLRILYASL